MKFEKICCQHLQATKDEIDNTDLLAGLPLDKLKEQLRLATEYSDFLLAAVNRGYQIQIMIAVDGQFACSSPILQKGSSCDQTILESLFNLSINEKNRLMREMETATIREKNTQLRYVITNVYMQPHTYFDIVSSLFVQIKCMATWFDEEHEAIRIIQSLTHRTHLIIESFTLAELQEEDIFFNNIRAVWLSEAMELRRKKEREGDWGGGRSGL